ncbi:unnamed protein product [Pleuronectes platessa]|uniref:Uncharacterized protein n=1 Tax=Pleuronectes platessa TaxID=8262 RepID=A0A9N7Z6H7_PLEPL|nr:unnamed protein product [Pleuronectes platessa]
MIAAVRQEFTQNGGCNGEQPRQAPLLSAKKQKSEAALDTDSRQLKNPFGNPGDDGWSVMGKHRPAHQRSASTAMVSKSVGAKTPSRPGEEDCWVVRGFKKRHALPVTDRQPCNPTAPIDNRDPLHPFT